MLHIIWSIILGFIAGLIARLIMRTHMDFLLTTLLGIAAMLLKSRKAILWAPLQ
jgi:uncharacterized membrane protein YeaQ/YmgE (transglycosylase-associated protein family)